MKDISDLEKAFAAGANLWTSKIVKVQSGAIGLHAIAAVKKRTPVDTGHLRRSWRHSVEAHPSFVRIWILNNVNYAPSVNYGHRIVRNGRTRGKTKGKYMLELGIRDYKRSQLGNDISRMLEELKRGLK